MYEEILKGIADLKKHKVEEQYIIVKKSYADNNFSKEEPTFINRFNGVPCLVVEDDTYNKVISNESHWIIIGDKESFEWAKLMVASYEFNKE